MNKLKDFWMHLLVADSNDGSSVIPIGALLILWLVARFFPEFAPKAALPRKKRLHSMAAEENSGINNEITFVKGS